jgi:hypothetical protein
MRHATGPGRLFEPLGRAVGRLTGFVEGVAFWAAATFPFVHLAAALLYVQESISSSGLVALAVLNAAAIVVGHRYKREGVPADE